MSSVTISGDTSGSIILQAPSVAGSTTLTLPTTTGTLSLTASPTFTGQATIPTINLTGGQITFPATQNPSADANCLDDYEEGTWTPNVGGTATYYIQDGRYTKVGKLVNCVFDFSVNVIGTGSATTLSGLPFTNSSTVATGSVSFYASIPSSVNFISFYSNASTAILTFVANTANATTISLNGFAIFGNSARVIGSITYQTA